MAARRDSVGHLKPGTISDVIAHPPTCSAPSRTSGLRPALARSVAVTRLVSTPAPMMTTMLVMSSFCVDVLRSTVSTF